MDINKKATTTIKKTAEVLHKQKESDLLCVS